MSRDEHDRLEDILDAIVAIKSHLDRPGETDADSLVLQDAVRYRLLVIGEAVKDLPPELSAQEPDVRWREIAGLRDLLAHEYFRIDADRILGTVEQALPPLEAAVRRLLGR